MYKALTAIGVKYFDILRKYVVAKIMLAILGARKIFGLRQVLSLQRSFKLGQECDSFHPSIEIYGLLTSML